MPRKVQKPKVAPTLDREDYKLRELYDYRRRYFTELLGEDCPYLDALVSKLNVDRADVVDLLERGCPVAIVPKILL